MQRLQLPDNPIENKTAVMIGDPKSAMSARVIPLTDFIVDFCKKMEIPSPQAFVLTGETERYMEPRTLQYRFAKYAKELVLLMFIFIRCVIPLLLAVWKWDLR